MSWDGDVPEFLSPKELHELPKLNNLAEGSIDLMSFSISPRTLTTVSATTLKPLGAEQGGMGDENSLFFDFELLIRREEGEDEGKE